METTMPTRVNHSMLWGGRSNYKKKGLLQEFKTSYFIGGSNPFPLMSKGKRNQEKKTRGMQSGD